MSPSTAPEVRRWIAARGANPPDWSEDASRYEVTAEQDAWSAFLVLADGAGSTAFPGEWARALVDAAEPAWLDGGIYEGIAGVRRDFDPLTDLEDDDDAFLFEELWYERGSAATLLLAKAVHDCGSTHCRVVCVGDSIAVVSAPGRLTSFPLRTSREFSNRTPTVRTAVTGLELKTWASDLPAGSMLVLASDGIGKWILRHGERHGPERVHALLRTFSDADVPDVEDDVTLLILDVPGPANAQDSVVDWVLRRLRVR